MLQEEDEDTIASMGRFSSLLPSSLQHLTVEIDVDDHYFDWSITHDDLNPQKSLDTIPTCVAGLLSMCIAIQSTRNSLSRSGWDHARSVFAGAGVQLDVHHIYSGPFVPNIVPDHVDSCPYITHGQLIKRWEEMI